jgi:hypothetical protein
MLHLGRSNRYDGVLEYWVIVKEAAEHTESLTQEEIHRQKKKAGHPGNQTSQSNMSHLPRRWMILPCRRWTRQASRSWRIASAEAKGPDRVAAEVEAIGLLSNCILYTLQWLHLYI